MSVEQSRRSKPPAPQAPDQPNTWLAMGVPTIVVMDRGPGFSPSEVLLRALGVIVREEPEE